jgi:hypothetical protein
MLSANWLDNLDAMELAEAYIHYILDLSFFFFVTVIIISRLLGFESNDAGTVAGIRSRRP